ncbi:DUF6249 domain-containing protein [Maribellus maritimus]|uniref:DUF6249 domain-containing protein n=1 Tax=Maribellus maritimus TaxID=2870838 RepID=UPI001EEC1453|nr:DUF6249 domain-containing protein [Maribellus maritimus]MCG6190435.1 hypothetical protein [Maribellus maritimus]
MNVMGDVLIPAVIFFGMYHIIKLISEHLLKRKLIKAEQYDKAGILEPPKSVSEEGNKYPSLKWGLVALMTGLGFIIIEVMRLVNPNLIDYHNAVLPIGILLVFVSLGFLIYFFIMNGRKKK